MRKLIVIALLASLAACGSKTYYVSQTAAPTEAPTTTKPRPTTTAPKPVYTTQPSYGSSYDEDMFVASVYDLFSGPIFVSDYEMIKTGRMTCASLQSGMTGDQLFDTLIDASNYDAQTLEFLSAIVASAIVWFCPEQAWKIA